MNNIRHFWLTISNSGVRSEFDFEKIKKIRLTNQFCVATIVVSLAYTLFLLVLGSVQLATLDLGITLCSIVVMIVVRKNHFILAVNILFLTVPILLLLINKVYGKVGAEYYTFPLLIFCYYIFNEKRVVTYYLLMFTVLFILSKYFESTTVPTGTAAVLAPWFYLVNITCSFLIGGMFLRVFVREHLRHQKEMEEKNILLEEAMSETRAKNREITFLLKELNHRTKNNLQLVSSLMSIQAEGLPESEARNLIEESRNRIASIALLHQKLYRNESVTRVNFREFLADLISHHKEIFEDKKQPVTIESKVDDFNLNIDNAVTLGLILNEMLTNSIKHGLKVDAQKKIMLEIFPREEDILDVTYRDNGNGISRMFDTNQSGSFGGELVRSLIRQMHGEFMINEPGTNSVKITLQINQRP